MKTRTFIAASLAAPLLLLCAWPRTSFAQAATNGSVVAWGDNYYGQTTVPLAAQSGVTAIAAGISHTVALKNDGTVVAWGNNNNGQVTDGPNSAIASPVTLGGQVLSGVTGIAAGYEHTVALKNDGSVVSWGRFDQTTVPVAAQSGVAAIAAGIYHTVALKNDGMVVAWGNYEPLPTPVTLGGQVLSGVTAIAGESITPWRSSAACNCCPH